MNQIQFTQTIPNTDSEAFKHYYKEIQKYGVLSKEDEISYLKKLLTDDREKAIEVLMKHNLKLVVLVAKQYQNYDNLEDLVQVGNLGLYDAIQKYDCPDYSIRLNTFAVKKIQGKILDYLRSNKKGIPIPTNKNTQATKVYNFINKFEVENEFEPTDDIICEHFKITKDQLDDIRAIIDISFNQEINEDGESSLSSLSESDPEYKEYSEFILKVKELLTDKEFKILADNFGINTKELEVNKIADKYGISADRVRYIINNAIIKLRKYPELINYFKG